MAFVPINRSAASLASKAETLPSALPTPSMPSDTGAASRRPYVSSRNFMSRKENGELAGQLFAIRHYAGEVAYHAAQLVEKNRDTLFPDVLHLLRTSTNPLVVDAFDDTSNGGSNKGTGGVSSPVSPKEGSTSSKGRESMCHRMQQEVADLLSLLEQGNPHYVRCVRPNAQRRSGKVDRMLVSQQVRYLGLVESVKVRRVGYCFNLEIAEFVNRYRLISRNTWLPLPAGEAAAGTTDAGRSAWLVQAAKSILSSGEPSEWSSKFPPVPPVNLTDGRDFCLGKTKVFIKNPSGVQNLEFAREAALMPITALIQARWRTAQAKTAYRDMRAAALRLQATGRRVGAQQRKSRGIAGCVKMQAYLRAKLARRRAWKVKARFLLQRCVRRMLAVLRVVRMRAQYKNKPPRVWATCLERAWRGAAARAAIDPAVRHRCREAADTIAFYSPARRSAVTTITSNIRRRSARTKWLACKSAALTLNKVSRMALAKRQRCVENSLPTLFSL